MRFMFLRRRLENGQNPAGGRQDRCEIDGVLRILLPLQPAESLGEIRAVFLSFKNDEPEREQ